MSKRSAKTPTRSARLTAYRPTIDRLVFGIALLGVLTTVHLIIQQSRGFDRGCLGFSAPVGVEAAFNCNLVVESGAGSLFGLSNGVLGLLFYLLVAALSAALLFVKGAWLGRLKKGRAAVIAAGFAYSVYLVYFQYAVLGEFCALCLISAALATLLFVLQAVDLARPFPAASGSRTAAQPASRSRDLALFGALAALVLVLAGADVAYYRSLEPAAPPAAALAQPVADAGDPQDACAFDASKEAVENVDELVGMNDLMAGEASAPVTVVEYFDPNCPHCADLHPVMQSLIQEYGDQARFVYKPVPLWEFSVPQIAALYAARQEGKFKEMLTRQFALHQPGRGLDLPALRGIAQEIGMNPDVMEQRIRSGIFFPVMRQEKERAAEIGVTGVPAVLINGRFVEGSSRTRDCLAQLIEEAAQEG